MVLASLNENGQPGRSAPPRLRCRHVRLAPSAAQGHARTGAGGKVGPWLPAWNVPAMRTAASRVRIATVFVVGRDKRNSSLYRNYKQRK